MLPVGFVLRYLRLYSYALLVFDEESVISYLASPRIQSPVGQRVFLDIQGQGGTGPRIPDRGVVGRSGHQAVKKKMDPTAKSFLERIFYHLRFR